MSDNSFTDAYNKTIGQEVRPENSVIEKRDGLSISLSDDTFARTANKLIKDSETFYNKEYSLKERREKMWSYFFGKQLRERKLKEYESRFQDNLLYEAIAYLKPIALSQMPDIITSPGSDNPQSKDTSEMLSKYIDSDIKKAERRKVLGMSFKHLQVLLLGAIKPYWDPVIGDYNFRWVFPENLVLDYTSPDLDPDHMQFIAEYVPNYSVKELVMMFPKKEQKLYAALRRYGVFDDGGKNENNEAGMNTKVKITEIWFDHLEQTKENGESTFERQACVGWLYKDFVFDKIKDPNYDWEGQTKIKGNVDELSVRLAIATGQPIPTEKVFYNYFDHPSKPYIFMGYDQWGKQPLDETSIVEQAIPLQEEHDKRGRQISEMLDRARGKHIFSTDSGLKTEDIEELDMTDPDADMVVEGNVNNVHSFIPGEQPSSQAFNDLALSEQRLFAKMGVNGTVRGQPSSEVATNNQLSREGDFTRADDLTEETINNASRRMAEWILQFIKLRYTEDKFKKTMGPNGETIFTRLNRDMVDDGMEVVITASGTDKVKAKQQAIDMAKLKMIDPLTFYKDLGVSDPQGRTEKLLTFMSDPQGYMAKYAMGLQDTNAMAGALAQQPAQPGLPPGQAPVPGAPPAAQFAPPNPQAAGPITGNPQPGNTAQVNVLPPQPSNSLV
jgi:hypothetical protein